MFVFIGCGHSLRTVVFSVEVYVFGYMLWPGTALVTVDCYVQC